MTCAAPATWWACARCVHGRDAGLVCTHPRARVAYSTSAVRVELIRESVTHCGPNGRWHQYGQPLAMAA